MLRWCLSLSTINRPWIWTVAVQALSEHNILGAQLLSVDCSQDPANCEKGVVHSLIILAGRPVALLHISGEGTNRGLLLPRWGFAEPRFFL